jgi:MFS family permease
MLGSALCGLAWNVAALIAARGLQAVGASVVFASCAAILTGNFPATQRGQAMGLQAVLIYLGRMTGPVLGGWLTDHFTWRAVFYINVPVCLLALILSAIFIPRDEPRSVSE